MKRFTVLFSILLVVVWSAAAWANSAPVVSNITVSQRTDGSKKVDIRYNLSDADGDRCTVSRHISDDRGTTWNVYATSFSGDVDPSIIPDKCKHIVWDSKKDVPESC
jgi:hypothetical protein